jgi:hypothetical protein
MESYIVHMADTPGFDDPFATDSEDCRIPPTSVPPAGHALRDSLSASNYRRSNERFCSQNLDMFQKLMGTTALTNCILVTTKWGLVDPAIGQAREKELKRDPRFWANMIAHKARVERFDGSTQSAIRIIQSISGLPSITTLLTKELCWYSKQLGDTTAGQVVNVTLEKVLNTPSTAELRAVFADLSSNWRKNKKKLKSPKGKRRRPSARKMFSMLKKWRAIPEIEKKTLQESQDILKKRADDIKITSQKRVQELVAAHSKASDHHILRNVGRVVGGVLGTSAIIITVVMQNLSVWALSVLLKPPTMSRKLKTRRSLRICKLL